MRLLVGARVVLAGALIAGGAGSVFAADLDVGAEHSKFIDAFNERQWDDVKALMAEDIVFHRGNAEEVYAGPDAVVGRFEDTIG
ncbi:MAG: nuclear transport factor 2 family protein, partial [Pseudomonadota bacterium]